MSLHTRPGHGLSMASIVATAVVSLTTVAAQEDVAKLLHAAAERHLRQDYRVNFEVRVYGDTAIATHDDLEDEN
jgi:hypothetical protein